jgi:hypothetical protein
VYPLGHDGSLVLASLTSQSSGLREEWRFFRPPARSRLLPTLNLMMPLYSKVAAAWLVASISVNAHGGDANIAYEEKFIWPLAASAANELSKSLNLKRFGLEPSAIEDQRGFFEILYFHELISCSGPLKQIAPYVAYVKYDPESAQIENLVRAVSEKHATKISEAVIAWNPMAKVNVLNRYLADSSSAPLPKCILEEVRMQSPILRSVPK